MNEILHTYVWIIRPEYQDEYYGATYLIIRTYEDADPGCQLYLQSGKPIPVDEENDNYIHDLSLRDLLDEAFPATVAQSGIIVSIIGYYDDDTNLEVEEIEDDET